MKAETAARYAIYYAPSEGSALLAFGRRWLGRDDAGTDMDRRREVPGFSRERLRALTVASLNYGFHATLKAPFRLRKTTSPRELCVALEAFARRQAPAQAPPLRLTTIGAFLALAPRGPAPAVNRPAAGCVRALDAFRAPPSHSEMAHRRAAGLSPRQTALLARWGYPHVMQQFRFHLTLTDPITSRAKRCAIMQRILPLVTEFGRGPLRIDDICLYRQDAPGHAFVIAQRFRLRGA
jgi:putative phosphonate metabolism protein